MEKFNFAWPATVMAYEDFCALRNCVNMHKSLLAQKQICVFGAGIRGTLFSILLERLGYHDIIFCDNNENKWGNFINKFPIAAPSTLEIHKEDYAVIISTEEGQEIQKQLEGYGFIINKSYFIVCSNIYTNYIEEFFRPYTQDLLILGDCGFSHISINDSELMSLGSMMKEVFGSLSTKVLAMHGMGMRSYYTIVNEQIHLGMTPKTLLLMVNFEVFTGYHHTLPRTQHVGLFTQILDAEQNASEEWKLYTNIVQERFSKLQLDVFGKSNLDKNDALVLRSHYMYQLDEQIEDMVYLKKILEICLSHNIKVLPFIPPANYEYAFKLLGDKFYTRYNANRKIMTNFIERFGLKTLDLSYLLTQDHFAMPETIDETANFSGRCRVKEQLKSTLNCL